MSAAHRRNHHIAWGATALALAATVTTALAPTASATIDTPNVLDCPTTTSCTPVTSFVAGHSYRFGSPMVHNDLVAYQVYFYDNGQCLGNTAPTDNGDVTVIVGDPAYITWVPQTAGTHKLTVQQGTESQSITVTVTAAPAGTPTPQQPAQGGCDGAGLVGTGSADLGAGSSLIKGLTSGSGH
ncbi:hypothetical protein [Nocardia sp. NPDC004722]